MVLKHNDNRKRQAVIELYKIGFKMHELRVMLKMCTDTIRQILNEEGIEINPYNKKIITSEEMSTIRRRIENGEAKYKIAQDLGITPSALSKRLARR